MNRLKRHQYDRIAAAADAFMDLILDNIASMQDPEKVPLIELISKNEDIAQILSERVTELESSLKPYRERVISRPA